MRRVAMAVFTVIALMGAVAALGIEANGSGPVTPDLICTSTETEVQMSFSEAIYAPSGYTLWSNDGSAFWMFRRFADGVRDTVGIQIPSGRSIMIPAPSAISEGGSFTHTIFIGGHTDTVYAMPWYR